MILLPPDIAARLRVNAVAREAALRDALSEPDPMPVVRFFNPLGRATWLATELESDGDTLFGLADLGFQCPELRSFSASELADVRLPIGLGIERDIAFVPRFPLSVYAEAARAVGAITDAERILARIARSLRIDPDPSIPPSGG